jgi:hypothetical protein
MDKKQASWLLLSIILAIALAAPVHAITINMYFDSTSSANPSYDPDGSFLTSMMQSVKTYWQDIIETNHTLNVYFYWQDLDIYSSGTLAAHQATAMNYSTGRETACTIRFDTASNGSNRIWYFDSDPFDSSEFNMQQTLYSDLTASNQSSGYNGDTPALLEAGYRGAALTSAPTAAQTGADMFSVALHEVGHGLGLTGAVASDELGDYDYDVNPNLVYGAEMAVNAYSTSDIYHVKTSNALMYPYTSKGYRTLPSATDVFTMAAASNWTAIDLPRKDFWGGESWNDAYNWEGNRQPDSGDEVSVRSGGQMSLDGAGNAGKLLIDSGSGINTNGYSLKVTNGTKIDGGSRLTIGNGGSLNTSYITVVNHSHLNLEGGTVQGNLASDSNVNISADSSMTGHGTLNLNVVNYGSIAMGDSTGLITINGDFTQNESGALRMKLGGFDAGVNSDLLTISGQANLSGLLDISLTDMFIPSQGDTFTLLTYGSYAGRFDAVSNWIIGDGLYFAAEYGTTAMDLVTLHAIPGDANYDGLANNDDLTIMANWYGKTGIFASWEMTDFNNDGLVNWNDLTLLATNYTNQDGTLGIDPALLAPMVPEPTILTLLALGTLAIRRRCL